MNFNMYRYIVGLLFLAAVIAQAAAPVCQSYSQQGREVTFHLDNGAAFQLKLCGQSVVRVWYSPDGKLQRSNPSFAVINEELEDEIRVTVIATGFERRNPAVGARGASRPSYNNSYAQQHSSEKQQTAAPAQQGQANSYGSGVIKPPTSDTEIPPWIRG